MCKECHRDDHMERCSEDCNWCEVAIGIAACSLEEQRDHRMPGGYSAIEALVEW